jgi:hypothetical protein
MAAAKELALDEAIKVKILGSNNAIRMAMIANTPIISTNVNPCE